MSLLLAVPAFAQVENAGDGAAAVIDARAKLDAFDTAVQSLSADFTQETWSVDDRLVDEASGTFALLKPGRFVWHTLTPYEHLVVADGKAIWMYDVELEQATRTGLDELPAANPGLLLSGDSSVTDNYEIGRSYRLGDRDLIELQPKDPQAEFSRVLVAFRGDVPEAVEIVDGLDQTTRIEFSDIVINPALKPARFEFDPPRGVDVIGGER